MGVSKTEQALAFGATRKLEISSSNLLHLLSDNLKNDIDGCLGLSPALSESSSKMVPFTSSASFVTLFLANGRFIDDKIKGFMYAAAGSRDTVSYELESDPMLVMILCITLYGSLSLAIKMDLVLGVRRRLLPLNSIKSVLTR